MIRFYAPDIESTATLPEGDSAHCCRVLRMQAGDRIQVTDGQGYIYDCEIEDPHPKHTTVAILSKTASERHWAPRITLAVAPTKNIDRMEWLLEKAVEIGVDRVVFLDCKRSVRRVVKRERMEKILVSAMKQSLKATLPEFQEMMPLRDFIASDDSAAKYMGYCSEAFPRREFAKEYDGLQSISIMIGPEGDFTEEEVAEAVAAGYIPVTFGATRLRTETAALYALCAAHTLSEAHSLPEAHTLSAADHPQP